MVAVPVFAPSTTCVWSTSRQRNRTRGPTMFAKSQVSATARHRAWPAILSCQFRGPERVLPRKADLVPPMTPPVTHAYTKDMFPFESGRATREVTLVEGKSVATHECDTCCVVQSKSLSSTQNIC